MRSHKTETLNGLSIVAKCYFKLIKILESLFVFATHLHQLPQIPEIEKLKKYYLSSSICYV